MGETFDLVFDAGPAVIDIDDGFGSGDGGVDVGEHVDGLAEGGNAVVDVGRGGGDDRGLGGFDDGTDAGGGFEPAAFFVGGGGAIKGAEEGPLGGGEGGADVIDQLDAFFSVVRTVSGAGVVGGIGGEIFGGLALLGDALGGVFVEVGTSVIE